VIEVCNSVRAAQTKGEGGRRTVKSEGVVDCEEGGERYDLSPE